jgi:choline dehydrogenase-like flavoprotein
MFLDAAHVGQGEVLETDLCIIGAGPAGLTVAQHFDGRDLRILMLESGAMKSTIRTHRLTHGPNVGESYHRQLITRDRAFAGTSPRWPLGVGWHARPLDPIDFEQRPGVPHSGWPIAYEDVARFHNRVHEIGDLGPTTFDPAAWAGPEHGVPLPLDPALVHTTMFQLGTTSFDRFRPQFARSKNIRVMLQATVMELATDARPQSVDRVVVARPDGGRFTVLPRYVLLAAGGVDNARLLLMSNRTHSSGLGNQHDLVGRFFMERLSTRSGFIAPASPDVVEAVYLYENHPAGSIRIEAVLRLDEAVMRREGLRNCLFFVLRRSRSFMAEGVRSAGTLVKAVRRQPLPPQLPGHVRNVVRDWRPLLRTTTQRFRGVAPEEQALLLRAQGEQAPNPDSRVTLDRRRDPLGAPRARLDWRTTADDRDSIRRSQEVVGEAFRQAGLGTLAQGFGDEDPPAMFEGNLHHLGTTRMHVDPRHGVVDPDGKVHGLENLFIAGSSVFPTAGASNPTYAIIALALRVAEHLERHVDGA